MIDDFCLQARLESSLLLFVSSNFMESERNKVEK